MDPAGASAIVTCGTYGNSPPFGGWPGNADTSVATRASNGSVGSTRRYRTPGQACTPAARKLNAPCRAKQATSDRRTAASSA